MKPKELLVLGLFLIIVGLAFIFGIPIGFIDAGIALILAAIISTLNPNNF